MALPSGERLALLRAMLAQKGLAAPLVGAVPRRPEPGCAPLSAAQERLYFLELYEPGTALYNDAYQFNLEGPLEREVLERALARLVQRHESLRTTFVLEDGGPRQRIGSGVPLPLVVSDLSGDSAADARAAELAREDAARPFEPEHALWRLRLSTLGPGRHALVLVMHHAISDGASIGVFSDDLARFYALESGTSELSPEPLPFQPADHAAHERVTRDTTRDEEHLAFWRGALGGELCAFDWPGASGPASHRGGQVPLHATPAFVQRLGEVARAHGLTSNHLSLAAWFVLLGAATGLDDLRTGFAGSLRTRRGLEGQLGFYVQSLVLRATVTPNMPFVELARELGRRSLEALAHADLSYDRVVNALERRDGPPLAPVFFSHMKDAIRAPRLGETRARWSFLDPGVARFDLALVLHEGEDGLQGFLEHDVARVDRLAATRLAEDYLALLTRALALPETTASELARLVRARAQRTRRAPLPFPVRTRKAR